jgi:Lrp/AsnC family transcriptional regulator, leucine-responsive regulatory protein
MGSPLMPIETCLPQAQNSCVSQAGAVALDEIDLVLLDLLQHDAGGTLRDLGETVRLSPSAVHRRIARYYSTGLITQQVAILDPQAVEGTLLAVVLLTLDRESAHRHAVLRARLLATPEVQQCYDVAGEWDYVVVLSTRGMLDCRELVDRLFLDEPGIERLATLPVFDTVKRSLRIPLRD